MKNESSMTPLRWTYGCPASFFTLEEMINFKDEESYQVCAKIY